MIRTRMPGGEEMLSDGKNRDILMKEKPASGCLQGSPGAEDSRNTMGVRFYTSEKKNQWIRLTQEILRIV